MFIALCIKAIKFLGSSVINLLFLINYLAFAMVSLILILSLFYPFRVSVLGYSDYYSNINPVYILLIFLSSLAIIIFGRFSDRILSRLFTLLVTPSLTMLFSCMSFLFSRTEDSVVFFRTLKLYRYFSLDTKIAEFTSMITSSLKKGSYVSRKNEILENLVFPDFKVFENLSLGEVKRMALDLIEHTYLQLSAPILPLPKQTYYDLIRNFIGNYPNFSIFVGVCSCLVLCYIIGKYFPPDPGIKPTQTYLEYLRALSTEDLNKEATRILDMVEKGAYSENLVLYEKDVLLALTERTMEHLVP
jgi:hypothetical protein